MSKNALALVDCNVRDVLFQYIIETFDRKATKNEMVSPYDDQLIGKMNFRYGGMEHAMFFTYAKANEYPGKRFRNRKILYLSLGVNEISSDIFNQICSTFGGFVDYNDDLDDGWQKIERVKVEDDPWQAAMAEANAREKEALDLRPEMRQLLKMDQEDDDAEERQPEVSRDKELRNKEPREPRDREPREKDGRGDKENREKDSRRHKPKRGGQHGNDARNGADKPEKPGKAEKSDKADKPEAKAEGRPDAETANAAGNGERKEHRRPRHHRGHRPHGEKGAPKKDDAKKAEPKGDAKPAAQKNGTRQE